MANLFGNTRKKKCSLRSLPHYGEWFWCLTIQCLVSLPCMYSSCQGFDNLSLAVYPKGTINVEYGKPVEIFCVDDKYTADDLEFGIGGKFNESQKVNATTRRLYKELHEKGVFPYYCRNKITNKRCTSRVLVDSAPGNVTDFACTSRNLEVLNCTWTSSEFISGTEYKLTFLIDNVPVEPCIAQRGAGKTRYCSWNTSSQPRYRQMEKKYFFNLTFCNSFGCNEQNFTIDHFSVVKPDPPSNLRVLRNDTHSVLLQWSIPNNMVDLLPHGVEHRIEYQIAKIDNTAFFRRVDSSSLPTRNKTYRFLLSDLPYAHMQYEVRIYIRPIEAVRDEFWSDFTYIVFYTASERPHRPPDTVVGAFDQASYENKRVIYVYWKQLEEYEESGENFTYKVVAYQGKGNQQTQLADNKKSLSYVILKEASLGPIDVYIWSKNNNGSSINSSHLYIPPKRDTEALRVPSFTKLAYENGTYKLTWVSLEKIDNYTLFWCQHNTTKICTGRMNFTTLNAKKNNHVIDLPRDNRYQFAISANNGTKTSGMVWATCDISKDGIPMYGFPVKLDHGIPGKSYVKITWTMACTLQEGIITGYSITYCPVLDTSNMCDPNFGNKSSVYISDPKQMEINITDLKPYRTYQFTLALNTTYGLKNIENASTGVTTTEDTPTSPRNVTLSQIGSDSLVISWDPPLEKNGVIGKYVIYNYSDEFYTDKVPDKDKDSQYRRSVTLRGLEGFHNYSWSVVACNTAIRSCSKQSPPDGIFVRTRIGPPSILEAPTILYTPDIIKWNKPSKPGGTVDRYQILRIKDDQLPGEIFNTTDLSYSIGHCEGGVSVEKYQVRAINFDEDSYHGVLADPMVVERPVRKQSGMLEYPGEWSNVSSVACRSNNGLAMMFILMSAFALIAIMYGSIRYYKRYRKMEDIKPVLPNGLGIPEKDNISKYGFGNWNPSGKDEKPPSDEMLLLPNSRATVSSTDTKQKEDANCGSSDHTNSTVLSDTSRGPVDRQASTSDDGSDSSLNEEESGTIEGENVPQEEEEELSNSDTEISQANSSPYFSNIEFKKNPTSGYVQQPVVNPVTGYVQSAPAPSISSPSLPQSQPASSSYVMAALSPPIFTTGVAQPALQNNISSGYVRPEDAQARSMLNVPNPKSSPTKLFGPESLPIMPTLPTPVKHGADSSYIQLQSLDSLPSHKPIRNSVPLKPSASSGYVSPGDAVINKHLNNMLSAGQLAEEPAILDPMMSPDAYCRFSWSTDPANDNLHTLLADSPTIQTTKN